MNIVYLNPDISYGFHITKCKTLYESVKRMLKTPLVTYQIYLSNGRSYSQPSISCKDMEDTHKLLKKYRKKMYIHGCLLYNLAGSADYKKDPNFYKKLDLTCKGLTSELDIGVFTEGVVVHIGSCKDKINGIEIIVKTIEYVLSNKTPQTKQYAQYFGMSTDEYVKKRTIILENAAGEGSKLGSTLDEISTILKKVDKKYISQIKICIDTAHIFGAGQYHFGKKEDIDRFFIDFEEKIGLNKLKLFHLNDSKVEFNSKKDRHENLGKGYIWGDDTHFSYFISMIEKYKIDLIGEPPESGILDYEFLKERCNLQINPVK